MVAIIDGHIRNKLKKESCMKVMCYLVFVVFVLSSCGGAPIRLPVQPVSEPPLGELHTIHLGERLLTQAVGYRTDVLRVESMDRFGVYIQNRSFCRLPGTDQFVSFDNRAVGLKNAFGMVIDYTNELKYEPESNEICASGMITLCYDTSEGQFELLRNRLCSDPNAFQQVIEYNGRAGNILQFTYREFSHDRMRTPYTTNFTMDLSSGREVTYKGARLRVVEASNEKITYQVMSNFNNASF